MNEHVKKANQLRIEKVIAKLEKRNMKGYYCEDKAAAVELIRALIPEGSEVAWGGSATLDEIGIKDVLKAGNYQVNDPMACTDPAEGLQARRDALQADVFLSSANAITMDGEIVNIDGRGNRVAALIFGPKRVILVAGANKLVRSEKDAVDRIKNDACPPNCIRLGLKTPCALTGTCADCLIKGNTVCAHIVTTRFNMIDDRVHVVFVNDVLGF